MTNNARYIGPLSDFLAHLYVMDLITEETYVSTCSKHEAKLRADVSGKNFYTPPLMDKPYSSYNSLIPILFRLKLVSWHTCLGSIMRASYIR